MRKLLAACALVGVVVLGGCTFESHHELWPLGSGERLPMDVKDAVCIGFGKNGEPFVVQNYQIQERSEGNELWYAITEGNKSYPATFHRVQGDLYVAAFGRIDSEPGERIAFAWANAEYGVSFVAASDEQVREIAPEDNVQITSQSGATVVSGTALNQKKFLTKLGLRLKDATTFMHCVPSF